MGDLQLGKIFVWNIRTMFQTVVLKWYANRKRKICMPQNFSVISLKRSLELFVGTGFSTNALYALVIWTKTDPSSLHGSMLPMTQTNLFVQMVKIISMP